MRTSPGIHFPAPIRQASSGNNVEGRRNRGRCLTRQAAMRSVIGIDQVIEEWHRLADRPLEELERVFSEESLRTVRRLVELALNSNVETTLTSPNDFAYLRQRAKGQRASMESASLRCDSQGVGAAQVGDLMGAAALLAEFGGECPQTTFRDVAAIQRVNVTEDE